jgi:hypothetical protein
MTATNNNHDQDPLDCYHRAEPGEPTFTLLGRDKHAPILVWLWALLRQMDGEKPERVHDARERAMAMLGYLVGRGRRAVGIGQAAMAAVTELVNCAGCANLVEDESDSQAAIVGRFRALLVITDFMNPDGSPVK